MPAGTLHDKASLRCAIADGPPQREGGAKYISAGKFVGRLGGLSRRSMITADQASAVFYGDASVHR